MSTLGNGRTTSSIFPWSKVILLVMPFTSTISRAFSMMDDMSTPITCFAPARTANLWNPASQLAVDQCFPYSLYVHAENASSTSYIEDDLILEDMAILVDSIAIRSCANIIFLQCRKIQSANVRKITSTDYLPAFPHECLK